MRRPLISALLCMTLVGLTGCGSSPQVPPEEVWTEFVTALNAKDLATIEQVLAPDIEWTWDSDLLAIHNSATGRDQAVSAIADLIERGVTFDTSIIEAEDTTLTARTEFREPGLAEFLGGQSLLQTDVVTIRNGVIATWTSTANRTIPVEE